MPHANTPSTRHGATAEAASTRQPTMLSTLAQRAAAHPQIEAAVLGALRAALPQVIEGLLSDMYPGERVRIYARKTGAHAEREARDRRIQSARHEPAALVARREGLTERQVRRIWQKSPASSDILGP